MGQGLDGFRVRNIGLVIGYHMTQKFSELIIISLSPRTTKWRGDKWVVQYLSTYVCSPLVIALAPTLMMDFNVTSQKCWV